ncbi:MAG TPA: sigma-70 family RNA polymerase sigma factor [Vicinamibacterales bacterium]
MRASTITLAPRVLAKLFRDAGAEQWSITPEEFAERLTASAVRALPDGAGNRELERYLGGLHLADLALAAACALGRDAAWDHFVREHRPVLYRVADALDPGGGAREIADALYADLYGLQEADGVRRSLFRYFHGRSSLATWLRAVLAQRHVDAIRAGRRLDPLPDNPDAVTGAATVADPDRSSLVPLVVAALFAAIDALAPKDRLRLRSYYVSGLTLAEIGRVTGEHEATVSRHLARTRRDLRAAVERHLQDHRKLTPDQVSRAFELALEDPGHMDLQQAFDRPAPRKEPPVDRSESR